MTIDVVQRGGLAVCIPGWLPAAQGSSKLSALRDRMIEVILAAHYFVASTSSAPSAVRGSHPYLEDV